MCLCVGIVLCVCGHFWLAIKSPLAWGLEITVANWPIFKQHNSKVSLQNSSFLENPWPGKFNSLVSQKRSQPSQQFYLSLFKIMAKAFAL